MVSLAGWHQTASPVFQDPALILQLGPVPPIREHCLIWITANCRLLAAAAAQAPARNRAHCAGPVLINQGAARLPCGTVVGALLPSESVCCTCALLPHYGPLVSLK